MIGHDDDAIDDDGMRAHQSWGPSWKVGTRRINNLVKNGQQMGEGGDKTRQRYPGLDDGDGPLDRCGARTDGPRMVQNPGWNRWRLTACLAKRTRETTDPEKYRKLRPRIPKVPIRAAGMRKKMEPAGKIHRSEGSDKSAIWP